MMNLDDAPPTEGELLIPMPELLKDAAYVRFLKTKPDDTALVRSESKKMYSSPPWVVYIQRDYMGKWGKREFWRYKKALKFFNRAIKLGVHDAAINNKRIWSPPPYRFVRIRGKYVVGSDGVRRQQTKRVPWKPRLSADDPHHDWCGYCRRPTIFKYFASHKRLGRVDPNVARCVICGASARIAVDKFARV